MGGPVTAAAIVSLWKIFLIVLIGRRCYTHLVQRENAEPGGQATRRRVGSGLSPRAGWGAAACPTHTHSSP